MPTNESCGRGRASVRVALRLATALFVVAMAGCASKDRVVLDNVKRGEFGAARAVLAADLQANRSDRSWLYERMMLGMVHLADGAPDAAETTFNEAYEILRTQGVNADKTVATVVVNERVKFWKGEPFEQALLYFYTAVQKAMRGEWDNARAAASESLFLLKNFGENEKGEKKSKEEVLAASAGDQQHLEAGYQPVASDFALGHLMHAVASGALGRESEAAEHYAAALAISPRVQPLVERLQAGGFNTLLVVEHGLGPQKIAYGPDGCLSKYVAQPDWPSCEAPLQVTVNGVPIGELPWACDLNAMAADLRWNDLEDVRIAKSVAGNVMVAVGEAYGGYIGAAVVLGGMAAKASAKADTKHCLILPQRIYLAPITVNEPGSIIDLRADCQTTAHLSLAGLNPPRAGERIQLCFVRMIPASPPPEWVSSRQVLYRSDSCRTHIAGDELPYILGGRCVCRPSEEALQRYQAAGNLLDLTLVDLENLYRDEGIALSIEEDGALGKHVLEGGTSLVPPLPGTVGYQRLFCTEHEPYRAKSARVRELAGQVRASASALAAARSTASGRSE